MVTGDELRALMRRFAAGVVVVTADNGAERVGITVGSLVSLSLEPPLVGISIARESPVHELLREAEAFAVNVLAGDQEELAQRFARGGMPPLVRFDGVRTRRGELAGPLIEGAAGWLECRLADELRAGTHTFFVAEVARAEPGPGAGALAYLGGSYLAL